MAQRKTPVVTVEEVTHGHYKVLSVYFTNAKSQGSAFHNYNAEIMTGKEVFEYIEALARNNDYILERNTDFGCNVPRILLQNVQNPGYFTVPYSL